MRLHPWPSVIYDKLIVSSPLAGRGSRDPLSEQLYIPNQRGEGATKVFDYSLHSELDPDGLYTLSGFVGFWLWGSWFPSAGPSCTAALRSKVVDAMDNYVRKAIFTSSSHCIGNWLREDLREVFVNTNIQCQEKTYCEGSQVSGCAQYENWAGKNGAWVKINASAHKNQSVGQHNWLPNLLLHEMSHNGGASEETAYYCEYTCRSYLKNGLKSAINWDTNKTIKRTGPCND